MSTVRGLRGWFGRLLAGVSFWLFAGQSLADELAFNVVEKLGIPFVVIPAGQFLMGTSDTAREELSERGWWTRFLADEQPMHRVVITKPFLMGVTEVTQGQWKRLMGKEHVAVSFKGEDHPVESVSFTDVSKFLHRLNESDSEGQFRLPTEAEWEYACRAGAWGLFIVGSQGKLVDQAELSDYAWTKENSGGRSAEVGLKDSNAWGLHDMLGNVWELCADFYDRSIYASSPSLAVDPLNRVVFSEHVMRGGSWFLPIPYSRSAARSGIARDARSPYVGFRLVYQRNEVREERDDGKSISK